METWRPPQSLLKVLKQIEHDLGRRPERRWGPRPIDLDILFYGDERVETDALQIPHPRILEREFVLGPLAEVMEGKLPNLEVTAVEALEKVDISGMRRVAAL
jgi:2-amino-4-hydroxy-6-hydroxymethyldihydropteridine diphosphokinase